MKDWLLPILFFCLACFFSYQWGYNRAERYFVNELKTDSVITKVDSIIITTPGTIDTVAMAYPVYVPDSLTAQDSLAIFQAFFGTSQFAASANAQQVEVRAKGWVWQNRLDSISFDIQNLRPTQQIFQSYRPQRQRLNVGVLAGRNFAAPIISYQGESWKLLAGYNLIDNQYQSTRLFAGLTYSIYAR